MLQREEFVLLTSTTRFQLLCTEQNDQKEELPTKERIRNRTLCHRVTEFRLQFDVRKPVQKHNYKATGGSGKKHKSSRDFMTAEFRSNQAEIKNQLNEVHPNWRS